MGRIANWSGYEIQSNRLMRTCVRIFRGANAIEPNKYWRIFTLIGGYQT